MVLSTKLRAKHSMRLRAGPRKVILGSGMKLRYGGEGGWWSKIWDYGKKVAPYALPALAAWFFSRKGSSEPPSQQVQGMVNNINDKYGQFLPQELQDKLSLVNDPRVKQYLDPKPPKPKRPARKPVEEDDDDDEPETLQEKVYGEGLSKKKHKKLRSLVKGGGLYMMK